MILKLIDLKTISKLEKFVDQNLAGASIEYDDDGQVVIYTGVQVSDSGKLEELYS